MKNIFIMICVALLASGCVGDLLKAKKDDTKFYTVNSVMGEPISNNPNILIDIDSVQTPAYMSRLEILSDEGENMIVVSNPNRWIDLPWHMFSRVIAENIGGNLGTFKICIYPMKNIGDNVLNVKISILECRGTIDKNLDFRAIWEVASIGKDGVVVSSKSEYVRYDLPTSGGYAGYVKTIEEAIAKLSFEISKDILTEYNKRK